MEIHKGSGSFSNVNPKSIFYRILNKENVEGFEQVYSDFYVVIYKIK